MSPASTASITLGTPVDSDGPLSGLVICVTGLSKETRKQVKEATERLGGQYSPHLHLRCTHLVVQSLRGHKFEHAIKHGPTNGLFLVTLSWFVDSIKRNVRLNESLYSINNVGGTGAQTDDSKRLDQNAGAENSCLRDGLLKHTTQLDTIQCPLSRYPEVESKRRIDPSFWSGQTFYINVEVPAELRSKVTEVISAQGASLLSQWFVGSKASHVVCEGTSGRKYLGHSSYLVTPLWVLKSAQEKCLQRLVHLSADLARFSGVMLDRFHDGVSNEEIKRVMVPGNVPTSAIKVSHEERQAMANLAKDGVRSHRNRRMQTCQTPIRPITPSRLLDSISWSISDPTSKACIYTDSLSVDVIEDQGSAFFDAKPDVKESDTLFVNLSRPLTESQKYELIFKSHFLTILFPVDRFSEMGPCSRTFFSNKGFTCLQVLDHIYSFYQAICNCTQENMSAEEIEVAIHTDSRHADRLRAAYCSKAAAEVGYVEFKRIDFLGSRKSFEMMKRVSGDNNSNVYELVIRA
ncbi:uncharacterized protein LOC142545209 isoform X1 [Primulina tabacum]|uniref:uncharacterized protein LOC142545209 isoform X1 n=1 Tax=Primulina tabacum TaxID=48773 RepID=UPI003F5AC4CB